MRRERGEKEDREKGKGEGQEMKKRRERRRNVVWRGVEGGSAKERRRLMEGIVMEELGRRVEICELWERKGSAGTVLIVKMER